MHRLDTNVVRSIVAATATTMSNAVPQTIQTPTITAVVRPAEDAAMFLVTVVFHQPECMPNATVAAASSIENEPEDQRAGGAGAWC